MGWCFAFAGSAVAHDIHVFAGSFGGPGSEAGKLEAPTGIAVNDTTHNVYVADRGNRRIEEFTSAGVYLRQFAPPGGFGVEPSSIVPEIAVDNSGNPLDPSAGDVYVSDGTNKVVDKFSETGAYEGQLTTGAGGLPLGEPNGVAVDRTGVLWVSERQEHLGEGSTQYLESFSDAQVNEFIKRTQTDFSVGNGFAIDSEGRLYLQAPSGAGVIDVEPSGELHVLGHGTGGVAVDTSNNEVFAGEGGSVNAYEAGGSSARTNQVNQGLLEEFGSGHLSEDGGVAVDSSTHTVYATDSVSDDVVAFDQVVVPDVATGEEPTNISQEGSVTLDGTVNPDGLPVTSCEFEYGTGASYGNSVPCEPSPGSDADTVTVHADVTGLTPLTRYHYRLVVANANGANAGIDRTFLAPRRAKVDGESVLNVASSSATLAGQVDPGGADTTYRFEYGLSSSYGESISGDAGSGTGDVEVSAHPQDLQPGSTYHYRLVAESPLGTATGEDQTFMTEAAVSSSGLPDGRAWEMVSPPNKQGASLLQIGSGRLLQAAAGGGALTYTATGPIEADPPGDRSPEEIQTLSKREPNGWASEVIATPHDASHEGISGGSYSEYKAFSSDLSLGLVEAEGATPLSAEVSEWTPYLRHDEACEAAPALCYQPLLTAGNVAAGVKFGGQARFVGGTPDLSHVLLDSQVALTSGGSPGLYEWSGGKLEFLANMRFDAVSDDGSRVIGIENGLEKGLFMRDVSQGTTTRLDVAELGALGGKSEPVFGGASNDGSRVFFTDKTRLTLDSTPSVEGERGDLYEFNLGTGKVSDLSVTLNVGEAATVLGLVGASSDGSYVYFVANGVLADGASPGNCVDGGSSGTQACNLYVTHDGDTAFIGTLSSDDRRVFEQGIASVSSNGRWLTFMSSGELTGYDNRDVVSGKPDQEAFLYDASPHAGEKSLVCVSCDPTGARPVGMLVPNDITRAQNGEPRPLADGGLFWEEKWLAAAIPEPMQVESGITYESHYLSNSGRLFFDSNEALVPQDTNGTWDVYEYEPASVGSCKSSDQAFVDASHGCVSQISSGSSRGESVFVGASETGDDVFFLTSAGLASQDYDGALDIYDAHVCSGESPCLPTPSVAPPPCSTGDSCKAAPSPQPESFGAPSSETFSGVGNIASPTGFAKVAPKSGSRVQGLTRELKACHKKSAHRRVLCERQVRRRYAKRTTVKLKVGKSVSRRTGR
jgi:hypothetical protein